MGFDDVSQTGLVLGLGLSKLPSPMKKKPAPSSSTSLDDFEPCALTLGFSDHTHRKVNNHIVAVNSGVVDHHHNHLYRQSSPHSSAVCSSFSGGGSRVKRERDLSSEEVELERVCSRVSDEDDDHGSNTRKKLRLSKQQSALLEESFKQNSTLNPVSFPNIFNLFYSYIFLTHIDLVNSYEWFGWYVENLKLKNSEWISLFI